MTTPDANNFPASHVNPWETQRTLMSASDQKMLSEPGLSKGVLLYAALNLEEGSEIITGLTNSLNRLIDQNGSAAADPFTAKLARQLMVIHNHLNEAATQMHEHSLAVRSQLEEVPDDFHVALTEDEVIEIADGITDLTVTNSGLALSLGIDGAACYLDVGGSNLSKRNPDTGKIDKTPDGKWIKGRDYSPPNLRGVIFGR